MESWRGATTGASSGWYDTGFTKTSPGSPVSATASSAPPAGYAIGVLVMHGEYGVGKVTDVGGHGALRKVKVRFSTGERTFIAEKAKLSIVQKG
jgi:DNA helicase II / ATP-dependent DNA helicase PcrA